MVVTGAGRGIGAAVARLAGGRGYDVCVNYARSRAAAEASSAIWSHSIGPSSRQMR